METKFGTIKKVQSIGNFYNVVTDKGEFSLSCFTNKEATEIYKALLLKQIKLEVLN